MSSLADVARHAGVSKATASRALSGAAHVSPQTRERVRAAATELDFVASAHAASLVTGRTRTVGIVTPAIGRWFFGEVIEGVEEELARRGYDLALFRVQADPNARERVFDYFLARRRVDGVVTVSVALAPSEVARLGRLGKPVVGVGGGIPGMSSLSIDDVAAGRLATEHLLSLGHRRIVHLSGTPVGAEDFDVQPRRRAGFRQAMLAAGDPHGGRAIAVPDTLEGGLAAALELLADSATRPTAIIASCDEIAMGVLLAAQRLGVAVPGELSIVGIDDHRLSEPVGLTTVRQSPREQGSLAAGLLLAGIEEAAPVRTVRLPLELVVRTSTAAARG